jgi:hypothetical protein
MPILHRDIETRSTLNLTKVGAWRYAADPSTEVLCIAYAVDDEPVAIWVPGEPIPEPFIAAAADPDWLIAAHNDQFEAAIEEKLLNPRFGWSIIPIKRHRCTMAMALANALPASLTGATEALSLALPKDAEGHRLMMQMAKPRRVRKGENPMPFTGTMIRSVMPGLGTIAVATLRSSANCSGDCGRYRMTSNCFGSLTLSSTSGASTSISTWLSRHRILCARNEP